MEGGLHSWSPVQPTWSNVKSSLPFSSLRLPRLSPPISRDLAGLGKFTEVSPDDVIDNCLLQCGWINCARCALSERVGGPLTIRLYSGYKSGQERPKVGHSPRYKSGQKPLRGVNRQILVRTGLSRRKVTPRMSAPQLQDAAMA